MLSGERNREICGISKSVINQLLIRRCWPSISAGTGLHVQPSTYRCWTVNPVLRWCLKPLSRLITERRRPLSVDTTHGGYLI
jgi:hypothetical protein